MLLDSEKANKQTNRLFCAKNHYREAEETTHVVCHVYLEVPNGHRSINASSAELATVLLVSFIDRHLAANNKNKQTCLSTLSMCIPKYIGLGIGKALHQHAHSVCDERLRT